MQPIKHPDKSEGNTPVKPYGSLLVRLILWVVALRTKTLSAKEAARFLMLLDNKLYSLHGNAAVRYGNGIHTKHHHMRYHDFFVNRIGKNEKVLDVGCGIGAVANSVAKRSGAMVTGIDLDRSNIEKARAEFNHDNIIYILGDALSDLPNEKFDIVILSNVLEHIEKRVEFLKQLCLTLSTQRLLIRVPLFERDWRVPLKKELGIDYRLDSTHFTEYTHESFLDEMKEAGLTITHLESRWGEI
jgi:SAM-dependent methyltransferase